MKRLLFLLSLLSLAAALFAQSPSWTQWRGPEGKGISLETGWTEQALAKGVKLLWNVDIGYGYSSVVISNGRLYTMGYRSTQEGVIFHCLDAATGATIWRSAFLPEGFTSLWLPHATPVIDGERVYGLSLNGTLYCLGSANGQLIWKKDLAAEAKALNAVRKGASYGWVSSPVVYGDLVLINADTIGMAVDKNTGTLAWTTGRPEAKIPARSGSNASPVVGKLDGKDYAFFYGSSALIAVDLATARTLWTYFYSPEEWHLVPDPIVFDNKIFLQMCTKCTLLDCSRGEPTVIWENWWLQNFLYNAVLVDGYLYGSGLPDGSATDYDWAGERKLAFPFLAMNVQNGEYSWKTSFPGGVSLIAADGKLIMLDLNGTLRIAKASPMEYTELAAADVLQGAKRPRTFPTPPVLCGGRIYCRNFAGDLVCIDVSR